MLIAALSPSPTQQNKMKPSAIKRSIDHLLNEGLSLPKWLANQALDLVAEGVSLNSEQLESCIETLEDKPTLQKAMTKKANQDVPMTRRRAQLLAEYSNRLAEMLEQAPDDKDLAEWVQSKIDRAAAAIQSAYHFLDQEEEMMKAAGHKYRYKKFRKFEGGKKIWDYFYEEHRGKHGILGLADNLSVHDAFALPDPETGKKGHFHVTAVMGDTITIRHDESGKETTVHKEYISALIKREHGRALKRNVERKKAAYEKMLAERPNSISLKAAYNRLKRAADKAGVKMPAVQRPPKRQKTARAQLVDASAQVQPTTLKNFELGEHTHTKSGVTLYTAKQKDRVDREEFKRRVTIAKKYKGRFDSRYSKAFLFRSAEDAKKFAQEVEGVKTDNFETMPEVESADNFETMPEVEQSSTQRLKEAYSLLEESTQKDELKNGRRTRRSINADKKLIEHIQKVIDNDFKDTPHPNQTPYNERTPKQNVLMALRASLSHLKGEQKLLRGSRQDHTDLQNKRIKSRISLKQALSNLENLSGNIVPQPAEKKRKQPTQENRHIQQISFREETQKELDASVITKDPESIFRLNKKGEIYGVKKQRNLYGDQTKENKLAYHFASEFRMGSQVSRIQFIIENAVANKKTPTELKEELGKLIEERQRIRVKANPRRILDEIYTNHNAQEKRAENLKGIMYNKDAIGLEAIKTQTKDYVLARLRIYGAADSVLSSEEQSKLYSSFRDESLREYSDLLADRYSNIADVRKNAAAIKSEIEKIGRQLLQLLKQRTEIKYQKIADKIENAATSLREKALNEQRLRALIKVSENESKLLSGEEKIAYDQDIQNLKRQLAQVIATSKDNAQQQAEWYYNEARLTLKTNVKKTLGEVTDAIEKEGGIQLEIKSIKGSAKEKLLNRMFNEVLGRLVQEASSTQLELPSSIKPNLKSLKETPIKQPQIVAQRKKQIDRVLDRLSRKEDASATQPEVHVYKKVAQSLTETLVKKTKDGEISSLGNTTQSNIKNKVIATLLGRTGTIQSEYVRRMLKQAIGGNFDSHFGKQITKDAVDVFISEIQNAYSYGGSVYEAEKKAEAAIQKVLKFNISLLIDKKVRDYIKPRPDRYKLSEVKFDGRSESVKDRRLAKYHYSLSSSADPYNRIASEYASNKQLEAAKDTIKEKTKEASKQNLESWSDYQLKQLRTGLNNIDSTPAGLTRGQVIPAFKKVLSKLGIENEAGSSEGNISLMAQLDDLQASAIENYQEHDAEMKAKQAHVDEMRRRYYQKIDELRNEESKRKAQAAFLEERLKRDEKGYKLSKRGAVVREYQREALRELVTELKKTKARRISRFGENLEQRENVDLTQAPAPAPQPPARQQLLDAVDQTAEESAVRITPRPSEDLLTNFSREPSAAELSTLYDRSRFLTAAKESTTKTGLRSKFQRQVDDELVLIHKRLDILAAQRFGSTAPRVPNSERYLQHFKTSAKDPESRKRLRAKLKGEIKKLYEAVKQ